MKKISLIIAIAAIAFTSSVFAQATAFTTLSSYYQMKDALVAGNTTQAAEAAGTLVKSVNAEAKLSDAEKATLVKNAGLIAKTKDLKVQRESFAPLSNQVIDLVKKKAIAADVAYVQYCPMKKASWLSTETAIKNPYYGNAMLTCGSVQETLKK
ncbi:DUF3347 domain-containing protein [Pedobacter duraquae]|uniref:Uncharacterized protein DUF3347 n=1 Tax=Pedobacter duraquae TaxID=425511 RepID=A0A4R6IMG2_9SPHI|nr:DUF3347 domain-containing protein [Pedobacter duraquae]TDO23271.1 uncharacterized protein DUF3347 [Pedobacter duraquae]